MGTIGVRLSVDGLREVFDEVVRVLDADGEAQEAIVKPCFFDPACGSGNFLTESYLSLRRLKNDILRETVTDRTESGALGFEEEKFNPIKVKITQFYGIEINDFAVSVAKTDIWIAESQMMKETEGIIQRNMDFLPLHTNANIHEGNALRMDWKKVLPPSDEVKVFGNPPFVGFTYMTDEQKKDMQDIFPGKKNLDYVSCWYKKASDYIEGTKIECAFVSTNSICQGETAYRMWEDIPVHINFAYQTFVWDSEAQDKAHVHCVIIGFAKFSHAQKYLYHGGQRELVDNINFYLKDAPDILVRSRNKPLCDVPHMVYGNKPADGGNLIIEDADYADFVKQEPEAVKYIKPLLGAQEYLHNKKRWVLWLVDASPSDIKNMPLLRKRVEACRNTRLKSKSAAIRKFADTPTLFAQITQPEGVDYLIIPRVSSERRRYVPIGFLHADTKVTDAVQIVPNATLYSFGIITSNVHMAWMRAVAGRLEMRYRYSKDVVYNNFPWPAPTPEQKAAIEKNAQAILGARELYPDSSLANLYDEVLMPKELREAHRANDRAVMQAYGFSIKMTEPDCVAALMAMYEKLIKASDANAR